MKSKQHSGFPWWQVFKTSEERTVLARAMAESGPTKEIAQLRREQAQAVMPLIGPLLDAWDGMPNDEKFAAELLILRHHIEAIRAAMEVARWGVEATPHLLPNVWHQTCETLMTMAGLSSSGSPEEMLAEFQQWLSTKTTADRRHTAE